MICALIIASHLGGSIPDAAAVVRWAAQARCEVRIEGTCVSACTMLMAAGCVAPRARLGFHSPNWEGKPMSEPDRARWAERMAEHYPQRLAAWYLAGPARQARPVWITGAEAVRHGARPC